MESEFHQTEPTKMDEQGRIIIPREVRKVLDLLGKKGYLVFEQRGETIVVRRADWTVR